MSLYNELSGLEDEAAIDNVSMLFPLLTAKLGIAATTGAISTAKRIKNLNELIDKRKDWGIAYRSLSGKPKEAIQKLKEVQNGFVPNAESKYGGIDFVWGKYIPPIKAGQKGKGYGLAHIEGRRNEQKYNGNEFLDTLPDLFDNGMKYTKPKHNDRFYVGDGVQESVIRTDYNGKPRQWLDSAYYLE